MSYFNRRPTNGLGDVVVPPAPHASQIPICPKTNNGWCKDTPTSSPYWNPPPSSGGGDAKKSGSSGALSELAKIFGALAVSKMSSPQQQVPYYQQPTSSGVSTTTMLIGGGIAVAALVLLLKD